MNTAYKKNTAKRLKFIMDPRGHFLLLNVLGKHLSSVPSPHCDTVLDMPQLKLSISRMEIYFFNI